jgi:hypothetical protein
MVLKCRLGGRFAASVQQACSRMSELVGTCVSCHEACSEAEVNSSNIIMYHFLVTINYEIVFFK